MNEKTIAPTRPDLQVYLKNMDTGERVNIPVTIAPTARIKFNLICASKCKRFALEFAGAKRAQKFSRVSQDFLLTCEAAVKEHIRSRIMSHPSKGKTLM